MVWTFLRITVDVIPYEGGEGHPSSCRFKELKMDTDELDPPRPVLQPMNLQSLSIEDLRGYISALRAEIERAEKMIVDKESHRSGAESLFRK